MESTIIWTIIFLSIISAYCLWRIVVTFMPSTKKSIGVYPSRLVFRIVILVHFLFSFLSHFDFVEKVSHGILSVYFLQGSFILGDFATLSLSKSVQDFAHFIKRETSCFTRYFWNLSIPAFLILVCFQIGIIYSRTINSTMPVFVFSVTYSVLFVITVCTMIYFPLFTFLREINRNDIQGQRHKNVIFGFLFVFIACACVMCSAFLFNWFQEHPLANPEIVLFLREPSYIILSFTQDLLDWFILSLVIDSESDFQNKVSHDLGLIV